MTSGPHWIRVYSGKSGASRRFCVSIGRLQKITRSAIGRLTLGLSSPLLKVYPLCDPRSFTAARRPSCAQTLRLRAVLLAVIHPSWAPDDHL